MSLRPGEAQLNARNSLGRVIIATRTPAEVMDRFGYSSEGVIVCCGTAYLTVQRLLAHQRETGCQINSNSNIPSFSQEEEEDPLEDVSAEEEDPDQDQDDNNEFYPIIDSVESLQAADIDDIDIFEEEPRALIDNNPYQNSSLQSQYIRDAFKNAQSSFRHDKNRDPIGLPHDEGQDDDEDDDDDNIEHEEWQNIVDGEDEDDDDDNNTAPLTEWDELEEVEIYGEGEFERHDAMSGIQPNLNVEAAYSERESRSRSTDVDNERGFGRQEHEGKWKCDFPNCTYSTIQEKNLNIHAKSAHDPSSTHLCDFCICRYKTKSKLSRHLKMFHGLYGGTSTTPRVVKVLVNGKSKFGCEACGYTNRSEHPLRVHVHSAHDPNGKFRCPECVCQYSKGNQLTQHISMVHKNKKNDVNGLRGNSTTAAPATTQILSKGTNNLPPKYFVTYSAKKATGPRSHVQVGQFKTESGVYSFNRVFTNNKTSYKCKFCSYTTKKKATIIIHSKSAHNTNAKYMCPYCPCGYAAAAPLHLHLSRQHPDKPKYTVASNTNKSKSEKISNQVPVGRPPPVKDNPLAFLPAKRRPSTYVHQQQNEIVMQPSSAPTATTDSYRLVFSNNKMFFKCEACGFKARDLPLTNAHIHNSHGPSAKHFCKYCTFRFSSSGALGLHVANVHPEYCEDAEESEDPEMEILAVEGVRIFRCKLCTYVVSDEKKLRRHISLGHDPNGTFACDVCTCRFASVVLLNVHKSSCHSDLDEVGGDAAAGPYSPQDYENIPSDKTLPRKQTNPKATSSASATRNATYSLKTINKKRLYVCDSCGQSSTKEKQIKTHITAAHHPNNKFQCPQCVCRYAFSAGLSRHISAKHKADAAMPILSPAGIPKDHHQAYKPVADGFSSRISNGVRSFKCNKCEFSTTEECMITSHKGLHLMSNKYPCHLCSYRFSTSTLLLQHQTADHDHENSSNASSSKRSTPVTQTSPVINFEGYNKINVKGKGIVYQCTHAGCKFSSKYTTHIKMHAGSAHDPDRSLCCEYCSCRFDSQNRLDKHMKLYHDDDDQPVVAPNSEEGGIDNQDAEKEDDEEELFTEVDVSKCQISGCTFETRADEESVLENHMKSAHSPKAKYKCYNCPCRFNGKEALENHIKSMHLNHKLNDINNEDSCSSDWRRFDLEDSETTEPPSSHSPRNPFQCQYCDFIAVNKSGFITHLTAAHSAKNAFKCDQCPCRFKSQGGLVSHQYKCHSKPKQPSLKTHTGLFERMQEKRGRGGQKPKSVPSAKEDHNCNLCSATFPNSSGLNWHMIRAHTHRRNSSSTAGDPGSTAQTPSNTAEDNSAIAKAARKYAEVEGSDDLPDESENDDDLFEKHVVTKKGSSKKSNVSSDTTLAQTHIPKSSNLQKCSKCPYTNSPSILAQHEARAHVENGVSCPFCPCSYKSQTSLKMHIASMHKSPTPKTSTPKSSTPVHTRITRNSLDLRERQKISEPETDDVLSTEPSSSLTLRSEKETLPAIPITKLHKCYLCSYTCRLPVNLEAHKLTAHVKGGYVCKYCPCAYRTTAALNNHLKLRHKKFISVAMAGGAKGSYQNVEEDEGSQSEDDESELVSSDLLRCSQCSFSTKLPAKLTAHINVEHPDSSNLPALNDTTSSQESGTSAGEFFCSECSFTTSLRIKLKGHEKKHKTAQEPKNDTPAAATTMISDDVNEKEEEEVPSRRSLRSRKRKSDCAEEEEGQQEGPQQQSKQVSSVEPKAKQIKIQLKAVNTLKRPLSTRTSTRRSAEAAKKVIDSVIQSEQIDDEELDTIDEVENEPEQKRKKLSAGPPSIVSISEVTEQETNMEDDELIENETTASPKISKGERHAKVMKQVNDRQSLKEVATLQRPTDLVRNAKQMQESKRTAGLREFMRFTCSRCSLCFDTVRQLTFHFHRCEENFKEFNCKLCDNQVSFGTLLKLKEHIWKNHMLEEDKNKSQLDGTTSKSSGQYPYVCSLCKFGLSDRKTYIFHLSVPHLFRCKKCAFVSGTKTVMDEHKQNMHKKPDLNKVPENEIEEPSLPPPPESDEVSIVYESTVPLSKAIGRAERRRNKDSTDPGKLPGSQKEDQDKTGDQTFEKTREDEEPEVGESLICDECGHFSMTLEDALAHNQALANIESLICFVCGYMASSPCDSILHSQTHQPEDGDDVSTGIEESEKDHEDANTTMIPVPDYEIEIEYKESPCQLEGPDVVDVPLVSDDHAKNLESDPNRKIFILLDQPDK